MKTKLTLLLAATIVYLSSHAQTVHYGVTAAIAFNGINGKGLASKMQTGYNGGAFADIGFNKKWSLQPEVLYTNKDVKLANFSTYYVNEGRSMASSDITLDYISIPVLVNYRLSNLFTVNAGPEYSLLVFDNDDLLYSGKEAFKKGEAGVNAGIKLTFSPDFSLFGSYYYGLSNINYIDSRYQWHSKQIRAGINVRVF